MSAQRWNFKLKLYEKYELPNGASLHESNMDKIINCAICGNEMKYGDGYTSRAIHTQRGFGYIVCDGCYTEEWRKEKVTHGGNINR